MISEHGGAARTACSLPRPRGRAGVGARSVPFCLRPLPIPPPPAGEGTMWRRTSKAGYRRMYFTGTRSKEGPAGDRHANSVVRVFVRGKAAARRRSAHRLRALSGSRCAAKPIRQAGYHGRVASDAGAEQGAPGLGQKVQTGRYQEVENVLAQIPERDEADDAAPDDPDDRPAGESNPDLDRVLLPGKAMSSFCARAHDSLRGSGQVLVMGWM